MAINIWDNFDYKGKNPLDKRMLFDTIADMKNYNENYLPDVAITLNKADGKIYIFRRTNDVDETTGKWRVFEGGEDTTIQREVLPAASADELGNIYEYVGTTTASLTKGYFYECVSDGAVEPTYSWEQRNVQPDHDTQIQKEVMPLASAEEEDKIYQYVGETDANYINGHFYKCVSDGQDPATYSWEEVPMGSGSGETETTFTSNVTVGGVDANTTFNAGTSIESIIKQMLIKYFAPEVSLSLNPSTSPVIEGNTIASVDLTAVATKRSEDITSVKFFVGSTMVDEITTAVASGGTFTYTYTPTNPIDDTTTFKAVVSDSQSDIEASKTITFVKASYFGTVADTVTNPTASDITALGEVALTSKSYTRENISMAYGKILFAYPTSYGDLASIKDGNNFEYINSYTKSVVTIDGTSYNCYLLTEAVGVNNFKQIYA